MVRAWLVCAICFVSARNDDRLRVPVDHDGARISRRQLHVTCSDDPDHDRFHAYNVAQA
jgi:hypothetical protein